MIFLKILALLVVIQLAQSTRYSCEVWRLEGNPSGNYLVDSDRSGPNVPLTVECDMSTTPATTLFRHPADSALSASYGSCENHGCAVKSPAYVSGSTKDIASYAHPTSQSCSQKVRYDCYDSVSNYGANDPYRWWLNWNGQSRYYWGDYPAGTYTQLRCSCFSSNTCQKSGWYCNCDKNDAVWRTDEGVLTKKLDLPVKSIVSGDLGSSGETMKYWIGPLKCITKSNVCAFPGNVQHGTVDNNHGILVGSSITYTCNTGYEINSVNSNVKSLQVTCTSYNMMTAKPTCVAISCGTPPTSQHASITSSAASNSYLQTTTYTCDNGYEISGGALTSTITCSASKSWSSAPSPCIPVDCGQPGSIVQGTVSTSPSATTYTETVIYTCNTGYEISPGVTTHTATCSASKQWLPVNPACLIVNCGAPPTVTKATLTTVPSSNNYLQTGEYTCSTGHEFSSGSSTLTITCGAAKSWLPAPTPCLPVDCGPPGAIVQAAVTTPPSATTYLNTAVYTCNTGYEISSGVTTHTATCDNTKQWLPALAACTIISCGSPPSATSATVQGTVYTYLSIVTYQCNSGFEIGQNSGMTSLTSTCQASKSWSQAAPRCLAVDCGTAPTVQQATKTTTPSSNIYNEQTVYTCNTGHELTAGGNTFTLTCAATKAWAPVPPICSPVDCGVPAAMVQATITTSPSATTYLNLVVYTCNTGYEISAGLVVHSATCDASKSWIPANPTCTIISCGSPNPGTSNSVQGSLFTYLATVTYQCDPGYEIGAGTGVTSATSTCQANKSWSLSPPTCIAKSCGPPPTIAQSMLTTAPPSNTFNQVAVYTCDTGHELPSAGGSTFSVTCDLTLQWVPSTPQCFPVSCGAPPAGVQTSQTGTDYDFTKTVVYSCTTGYEIGSGSGVTSLTVTCLGNKAWDKPAPTCIIMDCGDPAAGVNAAHSSSVFTFGSTVTYTCTTGYETTSATTTDVLSCTSSATWDKSATACSKVDCGQPGAMVQATITTAPTATTFSDNVIYTCNIGHEISSGVTTHTATCDASKQWLPSLSSCQAISCGSPSAPTQATSTGTTYTYQSVVIYTCNSGHEIGAATGITTASITCLASKAWSANPPVCTIKVCAPPGPGTNAVSVGTSYSSGATVVFTCLTGYETASGGTSETITCQPSSATWDKPPIVCNGKDCGNPGAGVLASFTGNVFTFPNDRTYTCNTGHELPSGATTLKISCTATGTWDNTAPVCQKQKCGHAPNIGLSTITQSTNVNATTTDNFYQDFIQIKCQTGHRIPGTAADVDLKVTCMGKTWSSGMTACELIPSSALTTGAKVGIGVGAVALVGLAGLIGFLLYKCVCKSSGAGRRRASEITKVEPDIEPIKPFRTAVTPTLIEMRGI